MPSRERASIEAELAPPFTIHAARPQTAPLVFCSPHSGRVYTRHFLAQTRLDPATLRKSEDCFVDELFQPVASFGAPLIAARFPRAYLDVNREPYELDPELFDDPLPDYVNTRSVRVAGGLGTVARVVSEGEEIYQRPLALPAVLERINRLYVPFHTALSELIEETRQRFGYAILVDCHSMPSQPTLPNSATRPDIVLGDRFGASCDSRIARFVRQSLIGLGYTVELNRPYAGGYITEHYGRPYRGIHALQIEINRGLYLDEANYCPSPGYDLLARDLASLAERLTRELPALLERRAAAE